MSDAHWTRVTKKDPCRVCKKPDYCTYSAKFGLIHCMRVASDRPSKNRMGGWIHKMDSVVARTLPKRAPRQEQPTIDAEAVMAGFEATTRPADIVRLSEALDVCSGALAALRCAWAARYNAYAFPMVNGANQTVGIRLRAMDGQKWAVTGSRGGIFWPRVEAQPTAYILEGPTDLAAALTIGLFGLGRPSCSGGMAETLAALAKLKVSRVVIVSDNDNKEKQDGTPWSPGLEGAMALQRELRVPSCIFIPPAKDFRAYVNLGATQQLIENDISKLVWTKHKK